ncbi:hypothetical protein [Streptosporangium sp. NPDC002524]|uniref:hypothetical protein n=1 Tax=Streptosporangium sp. NPDC002524 TaxID=3154537 RepID=UPI0033326F17
MRTGLGRPFRLTLASAAGTVSTLVLLPIAINVATGGTAPSFLTPYGHLIWPAIIVLWLVTAALGTWDRLKRHLRFIDPPNNRANALAQVERDVRQRLEQSLGGCPMIELGLDEESDAVRGSDIIVPPVAESQRPGDHNPGILPLFDSMQQSLLVLGAPGAGKTTLLLSLATELLARAKAMPDSPIPMVVNLAGWSARPTRGRRRARAFEDRDNWPKSFEFMVWLSEELLQRYSIPVRVGIEWIVNGRITLLLDGLDEVPAEKREYCVAAINELHRSAVPSLAVSSRIGGYERLARQDRSTLGLFGAIRLRPLTREQILSRVRASGTESSNLEEWLYSESETLELLDSPLMLNLLLTTYSDAHVPEKSPIARRGQGHYLDQIDANPRAYLERWLYDAYVRQMLVRRDIVRLSYPAEWSLSVLKFLATTAQGYYFGHKRGGYGIQRGPDTGVVVPVRPGGVWSPRPTPPAATWILRQRVLPASCAGVYGVLVQTATTRFGVVSGILVALCWAVAGTLVVDTLKYDAPDPVRTRLRGIPYALPAFLVGLALGTVATLLADPLAKALHGMSHWTTGTLIVAASAIVLAMGTERELAFGWGLAVFGAVLAAVALIVTGGSGPMIEGFSLGATCGVALGLLLNIAGTVTPVPYSDRGHPSALSALVGMTLIGLSGIGLAVARGAHIPGPMLGPAIGASLGLLFAFALAIMLVRRVTGTFALLLESAVLAATAELPIRRRRFLDFAADNGLLVEVNGEYRFKHLLMRDYLADCDPARLANSFDDEPDSRS